MLTSKFIKKLAKFMSQTSGHGSCFPYVPPPRMEIPPDRVPSEFAKEILEGMKNSATSEMHKHLDAGRDVHGYQGDKMVIIRKDVEGNIVVYDTFDPVKRAAEKQASRDEDQRRLESGEVTREELRNENSFIPSGSIVQLGKNKRLY